jgi:hypothetical protein
MIGMTAQPSTTHASGSAYDYALVAEHTWRIKRFIADYLSDGVLTLIGLALIKQYGPEAGGWLAGQIKPLTGILHEAMADDSSSGIDITLSGERAFAIAALTALVRDIHHSDYRKVLSAALPLDVLPPAAAIDALLRIHHGFSEEFYVEDTADPESQA